MTVRIPYTEHSVLYQPDYEGRARSLMLSQFHDKPVAMTLASSIGAGVQMLEDLGFGLLASTDYSVASGYVLDQWGDLVGQPRAGLDDLSYKHLIGLGIRALHETPHVDNILRMVTESYPLSTVLTTSLGSMGDIIYHIDTPTEHVTDPAFSARVASLLQGFKPLTMHAAIVERSSTSFRFAWHPDSVPFGAAMAGKTFATVVFDGR